ncbi:MAG: lipopolysaccharide kinase InaA family protein [Candidatus Brocadiales bacterium]|nr:lipopolysaccharide kinase InaA family protein [Candidatus Brocadiales bacterium]
MANIYFNSTQKDTHCHTINNIHWLVKGISLDILKEILDSMAKGKNCEIIHSGYFKKVSKYTNNNRSFYIKQYTIRQLPDALKSLFSKSKAQREWENSHLLLTKNLLTAEPVAVGERRRLGMLKDCYIISKAIPQSIPVKELLFDSQRFSANPDFSKKNNIIKQLAFSVKTIHDCGIVHGELHAENILVNKDNTTEFYLLDTGRTKFTREIPLTRKIRELSRLIYSLIDTCTSEEIEELIDSYTNQLSESKNRAIFRKAVFEEVHRIKRRLWNSRTKKCLKNNNVFKIVRHNNYTINMRNEWNAGSLSELINKHTAFIKEGLNSVIKKSPKTAITIVPVSRGSIKSVCIKEYKYPSLIKRFFYFFRASPARKAWLAAHGLMALNLRTPKPFALLEEKKLARIEKSFIIMEDISACLPCNKYVSERFSNPSNPGIFGGKKLFISCLAQSFKQLHNSGVYHADLKANNIMIMELPDTWDFFYLDLDRVCFNKKITLKKKIKNLSQLNASLPNCITYTDRLRFYRTYSGMERLDSENKRTLQAIIQLSIQRKHVWNPKVSP